MSPPAIKINVVTISKSVLGSAITVQEGGGLVQEKLNILCQGQLAQIDTVNSAMATTAYSNAEERAKLDLLWKYGAGELMNYNMEVLARRMNKSDTVVNSVQSTIAKQTPIIGFRFDVDRVRGKVMPVHVPGRPGLVVDLYSVIATKYITPDLCADKIWRHFARFCITAVLPPSFIRVYTLSVKNKTDYFKFPSEFTNAIKAAICLVSHFTDTRTKSLFPSVNSVVDQAITQLFYDSRKVKPGCGITEWKQHAIKDGWIEPGNDSSQEGNSSVDGATVLSGLEEFVISGEVPVPSTERTSFEVPVSNEIESNSAEEEVDDNGINKISWTTPKLTSTQRRIRQMNMGKQSDNCSTQAEKRIRINSKLMSGVTVDKKRKITTDSSNGKNGDQTANVVPENMHNPSDSLENHQCPPHQAESPAYSSMYERDITLTTL